MDAPTGKVIVPLEPAVGLVREKTRVVETLRQRVMAGFAIVLGPEFDTWKAASLPPTYEAYQEMLAARRDEFDFAAAAEHYRRPRPSTPASPEPRPPAPWCCGWRASAPRWTRSPAGSSPGNACSLRLGSGAARPGVRGLPG